MWPTGLLKVTQLKPEGANANDLEVCLVRFRAESEIDAKHVDVPAKKHFPGVVCRGPRLKSACNVC